MLFFGFSAGLPLMLIFSTLSLWLREAGVERSSVTYFSWAALGFSFKFLWAPLVDRLPLPLLTRWMGRRRSWMLLAQLMIIGSILIMALTDPAGEGLTWMALGAVLLGFSAATQDIVIDAFRIESDVKEMQALLSSTYIAGYRIGMLVSGAGALFIASYLGTTKEAYHYSAWMWTYVSMALAMGVGILATFVVPEPPSSQKVVIKETHSDYVAFFVKTYVEPIQDFFARYGATTALLLLSLVGLYRISDIVLGVISNVFYQDMGFSKAQIATVVKTNGLIMVLLGGFLGGVLTLRYGVMKILFLGGVLAAVTNLLFMWLAYSGQNMTIFYLVVSADNLCAGMASAAFVAFLSSLTNVSFTAVQYAIFSSLMTLIPKLIGGYTGTMVDQMGYPTFFLLTTLMGLPVLWIIFKSRKLLKVEE